MAYPDKLLADDEQTVEHLHPHWITLVPATLWFLLICAAGGFGIAELPSGHTIKLILLIAIIVVGVVLLTWLSFRPWLEWRTTHYVITTHRILIRRGVLRHSGRDIALQRISDVGFTQSLWERIVGAGTVTIESAGTDGQEALHDMPKSDQQQQLINRLIEQDSERRQRNAYAPPPQPGYPPAGQPAPGQPPYPPTQQYPQQ